MVFDADAFVQSCIGALGETDPAGAIRELVERAVSEPRSLELACPVPSDLSDDRVLHVSDEILVSHALLPRQFQTGIHDHGVEAIIGVWSGYEDNHLYKEADGRLRSLGSRRVEVGQVLVLGADTIHDVHTPPTTWSAALHVYLGNITALRRHAWPSADGRPAALDGERQQGRWREAALTTGLVTDPPGPRP